MLGDFGNGGVAVGRLRADDDACDVVDVRRVYIELRAEFGSGESVLAV
jgi:hypothetical protein